MASIWDRFDALATSTEVSVAKENFYEKPTEGNHEVRVLSIEPAETQQGSPILKFKFEDKITNALIYHSMFMTNNNYPENTPKVIVQAMNFVKSLTGVELQFTSMGKMAEDIAGIVLDGIEAIINVHYKTPETKYPQITVVSTITGGCDSCGLTDEDIPF